MTKAYSVVIIRRCTLQEWYRWDILSRLPDLPVLLILLRLTECHRRIYTIQAIHICQSALGLIQNVSCKHWRFWDGETEQYSNECRSSTNSDNDTPGSDNCLDAIHRIERFSNPWACRLDDLR